jgi:hypothetical protein
MNRKILIFGIIGLLLISGLISVNALKPNEITSENEKQGNFQAELGRRGSEEPFVILEGQYQFRNRFFTFYGIASKDDKEGRFRGVFRGNHFIIQIPIVVRTLTIFGRFNQNEDNSFQGVWIGRGLPIRGWISVTLTPKE